MRAGRAVAFLVVTVAAAALVRACSLESSSEPPVTEPRASIEPETDAERSSVERRRTRVQPPAQAPAPSTAVTTPPPAPMVDGEVPEEHRGVGAESVMLRLVDAATDDVATSHVRLWRLGVPADERWPAGDQIQDEFLLASSHRVTDLPPGRYRLEVLAAAPGTDDPPEFVVRSGQENVFTARIVMPAEVAMGLRVHDEHGALLTTGERASRGAGSTWGGPPDAPEWARPRTHRDPDSTAFGGRRGGRRSLSTGYSYTAVEAEHGVFDLGTIRRSGKGFGWSRGFAFRFPDRTDVHVRARSRDADDGRTYVAVSVPPEPLLDAIRFTDGTPAAGAAGADVEIVCDALPATTAASGLWRTVPIRVTFALPGYEKLEFTWCVDEGSPARRTLRPTTREDG